MKRFIVLLVVIFSLVLAACTPEEPVEVPVTGATLVPDTTNEDMLPLITLAVQERLAAELGVEISDVEITEAEPVEWPDACLGLGRADESCAQMVTPGWRLTAVVNGQTYQVRTPNGTADIRWE